MSSEPSTSAEVQPDTLPNEPTTSKSSQDKNLESERSTLLQQALIQAGEHRAQKSKNGNKAKQKHHPAITNFLKIKEHPLYSILELLATKCEKATQSLAKQTFEMKDIVELFAKLEAQGVTGKTDDEELDELMRGAILSLRTCLVELEKLAGLTDSFYCRYLVTMKRAVCQETLIGASVDSDDDMSEPVTPDCENRPKAGLADSVATLTTSHGMLSIPLHITQQSITMIPSSSTAETKTAFPFLHAFGFPRLPRMLPPVIDEAALQRGPRLQSGAVENSEEEKASS